MVWEDEIQAWAKNCDASESLPSNKARDQKQLYRLNETKSCARSRYTLKLSLIFFNEWINEWINQQSTLERLIRR